MPADVDQLFAKLAQQADATPLATAEQARGRGRQRTRRQAAISVALAVCLIAVGMGAALYRPRHDPDHTVGPIPSHALAEVGSPFLFGAPARQVLSSISGPRVFTTWQTEDGTVRVTAADLHTGKPDWAPRTVGRFDDLAGVLALPQAVLVTVVPDRDAVSLKAYHPDTTTYVYDPADGRLRWQSTSSASDDEVRHDRVLVKTSAETGVTKAYDWVTGAVRWTLPGGADRPVRTLGMGSADDSTQVSFTDERLVRVLRSGQVEVRNITTGELSRTAHIPPPGPATTFLASDGRLFDAERSSDVTSPLRVRGTDLAAAGKSDVLLDLPAGQQVDGLWQCGSGRLCLLSWDGKASSTVLAVDVAQRRVLWRADGPSGAGGIGFFRKGHSLVGGSEIMAFDENGKKLSLGTLSGQVEWLDDDALLAMPVTGVGIAVRVRLSDGKQTVLGTLPDRPNPCVNSVDRLVCANDTGVRIWSLTG